MNPKEFKHCILSSTTLHSRSVPLKSSITIHNGTFLTLIVLLHSVFIVIHYQKATKNETQFIFLKVKILCFHGTPITITAGVEEKKIPPAPKNQK